MAATSLLKCQCHSKDFSVYVKCIMPKVLRKDNFVFDIGYVLTPRLLVNSLSHSSPENHAEHHGNV